MRWIGIYFFLEYLEQQHPDPTVDSDVVGKLTHTKSCCLNFSNNVFYSIYFCSTIFALDTCAHTNTHKKTYSYFIFRCPVRYFRYKNACAIGSHESISISEGTRIELILFYIFFFIDPSRQHTTTHNMFRLGVFTLFVVLLIQVHIFIRNLFAAIFPIYSYISSKLQCAFAQDASDPTEGVPIPAPIGGWQRSGHNNRRQTQQHNQQRRSEPLQPQNNAPPNLFGSLGSAGPKSLDDIVVAQPNAVSVKVSRPSQVIQLLVPVSIVIDDKFPMKPAPAPRPVRRNKNAGRRNRRQRRNGS